MRSYFGASLTALLLTSSSASSTACSPCRVGGQKSIAYTEGTTNEARTYYETARPDEEMLHFPQGRTYKLYHGFGYQPLDINIFLSFRDQLSPSNDDRLDKTEPNNLAETAGNQAVIEAWNDEVITVRNDTCAEFYLRAVIIGDPEFAAIASIGGAAGAAGE